MTGYRNPVGICFAYGLFISRRRQGGDLAYADFTISTGYNNFCPIETDCHLHDWAVAGVPHGAVGVHGAAGGVLLDAVDHLGLGQLAGEVSLQAILPSKAVRIL